MKPDTIHNRPFWTVRQVMALLQIGKTTAYQLISDGEFGTPFRCGGLRVNRAGIISYIKRKESEMQAELDQRPW